MAERANFTVEEVLSELETELYEDDSEDDFEGYFDESDECGEMMSMRKYRERSSRERVRILEREVIDETDIAENMEVGSGCDESLPSVHWHSWLHC